MIKNMFPNGHWSLQTVKHISDFKPLLHIGGFC